MKNDDWLRVGVEVTFPLAFYEDGRVTMQDWPAMVRRVDGRAVGVSYDVLGKTEVRFFPREQLKPVGATA